MPELLQLLLLRPVCRLILLKRLDFLQRGLHDDPAALRVQQKALPIPHLFQQPRHANDAGDAHRPGQDHAMGGQPPLFQHNPLKPLPPQLHHLGRGEIHGGGNFRPRPDRGLVPLGQRPKQPLFDIGDIRRPLVEIGIIQRRQLLAVSLGALGHGVLTVDPLLPHHTGDAAYVVVVLQQEKLEVQDIRMVRVALLLELADQLGQLRCAQPDSGVQPRFFRLHLLHCAAAHVCVLFGDDMDLSQGHSAHSDGSVHSLPPFCTCCQ